jgi:uncharacterized protein with PQ loop repeat
MLNCIEKHEKPLNHPARPTKRLSLLRKCLFGYGKFFLALVRTLLFLGGILSVTGIVVIPLWYISLQYPREYGYLVLILLGTFFLIPPLIRTLKNGDIHLKIRIFFQKLGFLGVILLLLYGILWSYRENKPIFFLLFLVPLLLLCGIVLYNHHEKIN